MNPDSNLWPVDAEYAALYDASVAAGREVARESSVCIVAIARNAMPYLTTTLGLVADVRRDFKESAFYVFENDSEDETAAVLDADGSLTVEHETLGGVDARGFEPERTHRLAYCRNKCHRRVAEDGAWTDYTIVLDMDPHRGFDVNGVFNSIHWLRSLPRAGGMASYSLYRTGDRIAHYDAWAARPPSWWRDRRSEVGFVWFSTFLPPVGAPPCPMNSAFGGLCVYRTQAFLAAGEAPYEGGDCEHVFLHRKMHRAGWQMHLNPGCRYYAYWQEQEAEA